MEGPRFLSSAEQLLVTTLLAKLAVMAASALILVRFRRYRQFLIFEHRPWPDRVMFAVSLGVLMSAGVKPFSKCTRRKSLWVMTWTFQCWRAERRASLELIWPTW